MTTPPAELAGHLASLPSIMRKALEKQCQGDWTRVTFAGGSFTVHNQPQTDHIREVVSRPAPVKRAVAPRKTRTLTMAQVSESARRLQESEPARPLTNAQRRKMHKKRPKKKHNEGARVSSEALAIISQPDRKVTGGVYVDQKAARTEIDRAAVYVPGKQTSVHGIHLEKTTLTWLDRLRDGLPEETGFVYYEDVLSLYGFDEDMVDAVLRSPKRVTIRPETFTAEKMYPVFSFYRGDAEVILGFRDPSKPMVIAVYLDSALMPDRYHRPDGKLGGGGAKKMAGTPTSPNQLVKRLQARGCVVGVPSTSAARCSVPVTYKGQDVGSISHGIVPKQDVFTDWQRITRRLHSIDLREEAAGSN